MTDTVHAAGGVLVRDGQVCLVHRPRYDDWALPKGKLDGDEHPLVGAAREVLEETGWRGRVRLALPEVAYTLPDGRPKTVTYWLMDAVGDGGPVQDTDEVDEVAWLSLAEAAARVSYADERAILDHVAALPPVTDVVVLVRHAHAGDRKKWSGNDALRPIDEVGAGQAELFARICGPIGPGRLVAATPLRCKQTLEPLAATLGGMPIVVDGAFAEPAEAEEAPAKAKLAAQRLLELRSAGSLPAICSQGKVIPHLLAALRDEADPEPYKTPKGSAWLLTWSGDRLLEPTRL
ncbi:putative hydrolase MutT/NUDIX [Paractinoplanes abujensis]|uniref:8-oxo-dGTP diphosphatase n=1 Tax=Paractinoplanes abujensis TaxID=882441 RepID=A0A7W7G7Q1_9ACTN|nr:NUDIX domain-containing protein [Actinoplanes abujensis]MBB4697211.1 8-oxo-dGTP diphosphatase [Actinoplanes abujensis]GID18316.1 putative hydrolase MutT/NUDIX [Actinoplanes abujensis]